MRDDVRIPRDPKRLLWQQSWPDKVELWGIYDPEIDMWDLYLDPACEIWVGDAEDIEDVEQLALSVCESCGLLHRSAIYDA